MTDIFFKIILFFLSLSINSLWANSLAFGRYEKIGQIQKGRVLLIGIDGLGSAFLAKANTPNLDRLAKQGASSFSMQNVVPSISGPNWMSMLSGNTPFQHGVFTNTQKPEKDSETIFDAVKRKYPQDKTAMIHEWQDMLNLINSQSIDLLHKTNNTEETLAVTVDVIRQKTILTFAHFDAVDYAGHNYGFGSEAYYKAIEEVDNAIGRLMQILQNENLLGDLTILISSDHGGLNKHHNGDTMGERTIPFWMIGPQVKKASLKSQVRVFDIPATIALLLDADLPKIGRPIVEGLQNFRLKKTKDQRLSLKNNIAFEKVYDGSQTQANKDISIWKPIAVQGYVPLGYFAHASLQKPKANATVVLGKGDAIATPLGFERIVAVGDKENLTDFAFWSAKGSTARQYIALWGFGPKGRPVLFVSRQNEGQDSGQHRGYWMR